MSQPVKLSDSLVLDARLTSKVAERSLTGQIEFWAKLGRAIDPLLEGAKACALCRAGEVQSLKESLETVDTPQGRRRVAEYLKTLPFPHFEQHPQKPSLLIRIDAGGKRTVGRFVNRKFVAVKQRKQS